MRSALKSLAHVIGYASLELVPWQELRRQHTTAIQAHLVQSDLSPRTVKLRLAALRAVLKQAWRLALIPTEDYLRAIDLDPVIDQNARITGRLLPIEQVAAVFALVEQPGMRNARDGAILGCLTAGLRRAEVVKLDFAGFNDTAGTLRFIGKRNKEREVPVPPGALRLLKRWVRYRGNAPGPFILPIDQRGRAHMRRCDAKVVPNVVSTLFAEAKQPKATSLDFRRTFISELMDKNVDIATIAKLVGHESVSTTQRYDRRGADAMVRAADKIEVPSRFWEESDNEEDE